MIQKDDVLNHLGRKKFSSFRQPKIDSDDKKETDINLDPDDISVEFSYSRSEILKILDSLNVSFAKSTSTAVLNKTLKNKTQQKHPIHQFLKKLDNLILKDIASKIGITYNHRHDKMCATIAKYFFSFHSSSPLTSLKKCLKKFDNKSS